ncbi:VKT1A inhibitor, partial [Acromyrmex insinuator]
MNLKPRLLFVFIIVVLMHETTSKQLYPSSICLLPINSGPCIANILRYAYNSASGQCEQFVYGGCDGNANNFKTMSECELACKTI